MPFGGYVAENGISLCPRCHFIAESDHLGKEPPFEYRRSELFKRIGSFFDLAFECSLRLGLQEQAVTELMNEIRWLQGQEAKVSRELHVDACQTTWNLTCSQKQQGTPLVLLYGQGRG